MKEKIYILGVGTNTPVYIDLVEMCGYDVGGLYHYDKSRVGEKVHGCEIIGSYEDIFSNSRLFYGLNFALSMGDNLVRVTIAKHIREIGGRLPTLIHPSSIIQKFVYLEEGVVVHANTVIQSDVRIAKDTVISFNVGVSHNSIIDEGCYIGCQTIVGAYVHIKRLSLIGIGSVLASGKVPFIGPNAIVGSGSVVVSSVLENTIVAGNPAKFLKYKT